MLVLSRNIDETIVIGDNVRVTIVDIRGRKVRLGITAPLDISVHRLEVYEAIQKEKKEKEKEKDPRYGIGERDDNNGIGMWDGPNPSLEQMLEVDGKSNQSVIVKLDPLDGDQVLYRWQQDEWRKEKENV